MPWISLPFGDARIGELKAKYGVGGIPWLVVLDSEGVLVHNEADTAATGPDAVDKCVEAWEAGRKP